MNSKASPLRSAMPIDSFQSNWICSPGGVSNLGWASAPRAAAPKAMPCDLAYLVKAP